MFKIKNLIENDSAMALGITIVCGTMTGFVTVGGNLFTQSIKWCSLTYRWICGGII